MQVRWPRQRELIHQDIVDALRQRVVLAVMAVGHRTHDAMSAMKRLVVDRARLAVQPVIATLGCRPDLGR